MACRVVFEGELAKLRVTLVEPREDESLFFELVSGERGVDPDELQSSLEDELTNEARRLLDSKDVTVAVSWERGSLEVLAVIAVAKVVADIGAFLGGLREIRNLFPERIRQRISEAIGRDVAMRRARLETGSGLLSGTPEEADEEKAAAGTKPVSVGELAAYAGLALAVLLVVTVVVILGASWLV
jgi:hypothetical protein